MSEIDDFIQKLEAQRAAIDNALAALRDVNGTLASAVPATEKKTGAPGKA